MAGSSQFTVGTVPTLLASAPPGAGLTGPAGWFYIANGGTVAVTLAGGTASTSGPSVAASTGTLSGYLWAGDQIFGLTAAGTATPVTVLQTGL